MNVIETIKSKLIAHPDVRYDALPGAIVVHPRDERGFSVSAKCEGSFITIHFEGWHETFSDPSGALNCFAFGLSDACRLVIELRGSTPTKWIVQSSDANGWKTDSEVGLFVVPFWRRKRRVVLQNHVLSRPSPTEPRQG